MSRARTLSETVEAQERLIDSLITELRETRAETRQMFEDWIARPQRQPSETVELTRGTTGDHSTGIKVSASSQNGETLADVKARAVEAYRALAAGHPMADGRAHAAQLDAPTDGAA